MRLMQIVILVFLSVGMSLSATGESVGLDVSGRTLTDTLTVLGLDCTANANGGTLTTNASGEVMCSDTGNTPVDDNACVAFGISGTVVSGFGAGGTFLVSCFRRVVTTLAGNGTEGVADGFGPAAQFEFPNGVALDGAGNVYVADSANNRIRKVTAAGVVMTLAGGTFGFAEGTGVDARFLAPVGVAVDRADNVYVADQGNNRIRKVTPAGVVTTLAGSGTAGWVDETGTAAQFNQPSGVAVDGVGNVYVADTINHRIRKVTPAGVVTTLAGSGTAGWAEGTGTAAQFNQPIGVALDGAGNVYVGDYSNHRIRKVTPAGVVTTLAGSGTAGWVDETGTAAQFNQPSGVAVDGVGNVYVADTINHRIRKVTPAGVVTTLAGSGTAGYADGTGAAAQFDLPAGVAVDGPGTVVYVADAFTHRIRQIR